MNFNICELGIRGKKYSMFKFNIYFQNAGMTHSTLWSDVEA